MRSNPIITKFFFALFLATGAGVIACFVTLLVTPLHLLSAAANQRAVTTNAHKPDNIIPTRTASQPQEYQSMLENSLQGKAAIAQLQKGGLFQSLIEAVQFSREGKLPPALSRWFDPAIFIQQAKLTAFDGELIDNFGAAVAISGDTVAIGSPGDDVYRGSVYVFVRSGTNWALQQKLTVSDAHPVDEFGYSVALNGNLLVAGAPDDAIIASRQGSAYVFTRSGTTWTQQQKIYPGGGDLNEVFGSAVALTPANDMILVGSPGKVINFDLNQSLGAVFVFRISGGVWSPQQTLYASDGVNGSYFGNAISISSNTMIIGARFHTVSGNPNQGAAYVFSRSGNNWTEEQKLLASDGASGDNFGISAAIDGNTAVVGAHHDSVGPNFAQGSAYVFTRNGAAWTEHAHLISDQGTPINFLFGASVALQGNLAFIGTPGDNTGSVFVYERTGTIWSQRQKITPIEGQAGDEFGVTAISGETLVIGSRADDEPQRDQGSAYIFTLTTIPSITVNSLADTATPGDGQCTLREALNNANAAGQTTGGDCAAGSNPSSINFSVTGTINLSAALPNINSNVTINGPGSGMLTVRRNTGGEYSIFAINGTKAANLAGLTITNGLAPSGQNGGGIRNSGSLNLNNCVINGNSAPGGYGGGIFSNSAALTINNSTISGNSSNSAGGIYSAFGPLTMTNSTLSGNTAIFSSGGLTNGAATTTLINCTISGNLASNAPGGIFTSASAGQSAVATLLNCTVTNNGGNTGGLSSIDGGGAATVRMELKNTLIAANSGGNFGKSGANAAFITQGNNLDSDGTSGFGNGANGDLVGSINSPINAQLLPLGNYGGPTDTHALLCDSPATNAGTIVGAPATDQRGVARPAGVTADIGAFEASINLSPALLPSGMTNTPYNQALTASGGTTPYTFNLAGGALPNGLMINIAGTISGAPAQAGQFSFTVKVTDANGVAGACNHSITINACPGITVNPLTIAGGAVGAAFNQTFTNTGGVGAISWSVSAGTLPDGLILSPTTGELSGALLMPGAFSFTVRATDAQNCFGERAYFIGVNGSGLLFFPLPHPVRLLDTRPGQAGCFTPNAPIQGGTARTQSARGVCEGLTIPANAQAVTGNITTVESGGGYLTLYPSDAQQPLVANSNFNPNEILNNVFTVGLGNADGAFKIFVTSTTNIVIDVTGYYAPPGAGGLYFHPLPKPIRLLETRGGYTGCNTPGTPIVGGVDQLQQARTTCDGATIPANALAIVGNATTVNPGGGYLTLYPGGAARPLVASSNYSPGQIMNAPFTVGLGANGAFMIFATTNTDLVVDVLGYYSSDLSDINGVGLLFTPLPRPVRLLETRTPFIGCYAQGAPVQGGVVRTQPARGVCDGILIAPDALGIAGNATVVNTNGGYLTFWPSNVAQPLVATSNFTAGQVFNRHFTVGLGNVDGAFKIFALQTTDLVIDVSGYFAP